MLPGGGSAVITSTHGGSAMGRKPSVRNGVVHDRNRYLKSLKCVWATYRPDEILPRIGWMADRMVVAELDGVEYSVGCDSVRLRTFQRSLVCVGCGREGVEFRAEQNRANARHGNNPHLNLYAADGTLMTHDHVVPKSRGGADGIDNSQTMCTECNCRKADHIPMDPR